MQELHQQLCGGAVNRGERTDPGGCAFYQILHQSSICLFRIGAVDRLLAAGIPAGPINTIDKVVAGPHIAGAREMFPHIHHPVLGEMRITGSHLKLSDTPTGVRKVAPALGEDNSRVYCDLLGMDGADLEALRAGGVI